MADNKKEIRFSAKLDTSEFDRTVDALQKKIKDIYRGSDDVRTNYSNQERMSRLGLGAAPTPQDRQKMDQADSKSRRDLDQFIKQQVRDQERLAKTIGSQVEEMKKLQKLQSEMKKDSEDYLKTQEKLASLEKSTNVHRDQIRAKDSAISSALDQREPMGVGGFGRLRQAYQKGGISGAATAGGRMLGQMSGASLLSMGGSALAGLGAIVTTGSDFYRDYANLPSENLASRARQSSTYANTAQSMMQGRSFQETFAASDRMKALKMAQEQAAANRKADTGSIAGAGLGLGAGILAGATGLASLPAAAIGGLAIGGYKLATDQKFGPKLMSYLPGEVGKRYGERYENLISDQQASDFQKNFENQKAVNSLKYSLVEQVGGQRDQNQALQRGLGIGDEGLYGVGGFIGKGLAQGFTRDTMERNASGILSAGGSTRMARDADYAGMYSRDYGLTNSAQLLGQISGRTGSSTEANSSLNKILKESIKAGFDASDFAQENRKFVEVATQVAISAGSTTDQGFQKNAQLLGGFTMNNTMSGIQSAQTALKLQSDLTSSTTGPRAAIQASSFMKDDKLKNLSRESQTYLMGMTLGQLTADSPMVRGMANEIKISPEDFVKRGSEAKRNSTFIRSKYDEAGSPVKSLAEKKGYKTKEEAMQDPEFVNAFGSYVSTIIAGEHSGDQKNLTPEEQQSFGFGQLGLFGEKSKDLKDIRRPETLADKQEKGQAEADLGFLNMFRQMKPEMDRAAEATGKYADVVIKATDRLQKSLDADPSNSNSFFNRFFMETGQNLKPGDKQMTTNSPGGKSE